MSQKFALISKVFNFNLARRLSTTAINSQKVASTQNLVQIDVNEKTGYATLSMNRLPANSFNLDLLNAIINAFDEMEKNKSRGVILTSTSPKIFSAGLDISVLYNSDQAYIADLWSKCLDSFLKMYDSSFPIAAAVNGHAIAGGCFYAMICDYRAMVSGYKIGLNEIQVGVAVPRHLMMVMGKLLPRRIAEISMTQGITYSTEDALKINFIDEIASDKADAIVKCEKYLNKVNKISREAWRITRQAIRKEELDYVRNNKAEDIQAFIKFVENPEAQHSIKMYFEALKNKNK